MDVARPEERPLEITELVAEVSVPRRALLSSVGWALGTTHVENDVVGRFAGVAAFAKPEIYERLEQEGIQYAIRLPANDVLQRRIGHLLTRPVGRSPKNPDHLLRQLPLPGQGLDATASGGGQSSVAPG